MSGLLIFTDASVDSKLQTGFGACLILAARELHSLDGMEDSPDSAQDKLKILIKRFAAASPTRLEIETVLWALQEVATQASAAAGDIILFTDSQGIIDLPRRRARLERSGFASNATGKALKNADLYRAFYALQDRLAFKLVKLKGHRKLADKTRLDRIFSCVDKAARKALRVYRQQAEGD
jgi:ribonuclease HI